MRMLYLRAHGQSGAGRVASKRSRPQIQITDDDNSWSLPIFRNEPYTTLTRRYRCM